MLSAGETDKALAGATPYLRLFALAAGGAYLARAALADGSARRIALCRFFAENLAGETGALRDQVMQRRRRPARRRQEPDFGMTRAEHVRAHRRRAQRPGPDHPHEPPGQEERAHPRHVCRRWPRRSPRATPIRPSACHVFLGVPGAFSAGNDLADFMAVATGGEGGLEVWNFLLALARSQKPIVSGVDGIAVGIGTTLNLHCDLTFATPRTVFRTPFVDLGLVPEAGSSLLAPAVLGRQQAFALLGLGEGFSAERAKEAGLIYAVVAEERLEAGGDGGGRTDRRQAAGSAEDRPRPDARHRARRSMARIARGRRAFPRSG